MSTPRERLQAIQSINLTIPDNRSLVQKIALQAITSDNLGSMAYIKRKRAIANRDRTVHIANSWISVLADINQLTESVLHGLISDRDLNIKVSDIIDTITNLEIYIKNS